MADIFLSYARSDRDWVKRLVRALEQEGYSIWWDLAVEAGSEFASEIERELDEARAVIACWSAASSKSRWVRDEAEQGSTEGKLLSVSLDGSLPPLGFRQFHATPLSKWRGNPSDPEFRALVETIARKLGTKPPRKAAPKENRYGRHAAVAVIAAVALVAAFLVYSNWNDRTAEPRTEQVESVPVETASIAVLPFEDLSPNADHRYLADGVSEEIFNVLARVDGLRVASRRSSFQFRERPAVNAGQIARSLGVKHLLDGSVRLAGGKVRVTAQLLDAERDVELWSQTFDKSLTMENLFAIQEEIASGIVKALGSHMNVGHAHALKFAAAADTKNLNAYADYLRGQSLFYSRSARNYRQVVAAYRSAVDKDPQFTRAWVGLGATYSVASTFLSPGDYRRGDFPAKAEQAVNRALALEPELAMAHAVAANVALMRGYNAASMARAMSAFDKALQLDPREPLAYNWRAQLRATVGELDGAKEDITQTIALDPGDTVAHGLLVALHLYEGDVAAALKAQRAAGRYLPTLSDALALALARRGDSAGGAAVVKLMGGDWEQYWRFIQRVANEQIDPLAAQSKLQSILPKLGDSVPVVLTPFRLHLIRQFDQLANAPEGNFPVYWMRTWPEYVQHPARYRNMMDRDLSKYWKRHGYPAMCRPIDRQTDGRDFNCA